MLYPSCFVPYVKDVEDLLKVINLIRPMGFNVSLIGKLGPFYIDNKNQYMKPGAPTDLETYQIVNTDECLEIYRSFYEKVKEWVESLQVGSKVVIEPVHGISGNYPYSYTEQMEDFIGLEMEIDQVFTDPNVYHYPFHNGFPILYHLKNGKGFTWHSSEFVFDDLIQKISTIPITEIKTLSFL